MVTSAQSAIDNNLFALLVVVALALIAVLCRPLLRRRRWFLLTPEESEAGLAMSEWEEPYRLGYGLAVVFWLLGAGTFVWLRGGFYANAHWTSAVLLFVCIIIVVISNAYDHTATRPPVEGTWTWLRNLPGRLSGRAGLVRDSGTGHGGDRRRDRDGGIPGRLGSLETRS